MNLPISTASAASHKFCCYIFIIIHVKLFHDFLFHSSLGYWEICLTSTNLGNLLLFYCYWFLLWYYLGSKNIFYMISVFRYLLRFVLWLSTWSVLVNVSYVLERNMCPAAVEYSVLWMVQLVEDCSDHLYFTDFFVTCSISYWEKDVKIEVSFYILTGCKSMPLYTFVLLLIKEIYF